MMSLYLLKQKGEPGWDETAAMIVAAYTMRQAREIATKNCKGNFVAWEQSKFASCKYIGITERVKPGILLSDFRRG